MARTYDEIDDHMRAYARYQAEHNARSIDGLPRRAALNAQHAPQTAAGGDQPAASSLRRRPA